MFQSLETEIIHRVSDIRDYVAFTSAALPQAPNTPPNHLNLAKGLVDVHLYGMVEYTVLQTVAVAISYINNENLNLNDIKPQIVSLVLDAELSSLFGATSRKWDKRHELFSAIELNSIINIRNDLMPTDGKNFTQSQLNSIKKIFCIQSELFHDLRFIGVLQSIVGNRINVAHGNSSATQVGASMTIGQIQSRIDETFNFCIHFISTFDAYLSAQHYKL